MNIMFVTCRIFEILKWLNIENISYYDFGMCLRGSNIIITIIAIIIIIIIIIMIIIILK